MRITIENMNNGYWRAVAFDAQGRVTDVMEFPKRRTLKKCMRLATGFTGKFERIK